MQLVPSSQAKEEKVWREQLKPSQTKITMVMPIFPLLASSKKDSPSKQGKPGCLQSPPLG